MDQTVVSDLRSIKSIRPVNYRRYGGGRRVPRGRLLLLLATALAPGQAALCGVGRLGAAELHHVLGV